MMKRRIINTLLAVCLATGMVVGALPTTALEARAAVSADTIRSGLVIRESDINQLLTEDLELPTEIKGVTGAQITYSVQTKDEKYVKVEGNKLKITRPLAGESDYKFTLKATVTVPDGIEGTEDGKVEKQFPLTIRAGLTDDSYAGYVYVCFADKNVGGWKDVQQIHFFLSEDGMNWTALNGCNPIFETGMDYADLIESYGGDSLNYKVSEDADIEQTTTGDASALFPFEGNDQGVRDPYLIRGCRKEDSNKVWLLATDLNTMAEKYSGNRTTNTVGNWGTMTTWDKGSRNLFIWETEDWVHWTRHYVDVGTEVGACMAWAPEAIYNPVKDNYLVYWSARTTVDGNTRDRLYCNETEDFVHFGETKLAEQEPFFENWKIKKRPSDAKPNHDGYGNIDTSQLWVADEDGNPYGTLFRLVKDETDNHVQLMKADTVLAPQFEGKENQEAYDATDAKKITPFTLDAKTYSALTDLNSIPNENDGLKRAEIVWNWFKDEAVADHFEYIEQKGIENQTLGYEGATLFKFIDRDEWCVMIDNYGDMSIRYEPYLTTDLSEPNSIKKAVKGTYGRTGGDVGTHGGMIPITVEEYNTLIDTYNADKTVDNWHEIDYIKVDSRKFDTKQAELEQAVAGDEYTDGIKAQMRTVISQAKAAVSSKKLDQLAKRADRLLANKRIKDIPTMNASSVSFEEETVTICTKAADGLKTSAKLNAEADLSSQTSKLTYTSSNANVAAVDPKTGVVTAKSQGSAEIMATAPGGAKAVCKVTVKGIPNKVTVKKKSVSLKVKKTFQIKASVPKGTTCSKFKYKSNKPKVASVSADGKITAKKKGTAKITVTASSNSKAKAIVTVKVK